ncbi:MAG: hypothetical protein NVS3B28_16160 [Candidatus Velthaea sp.]
MIRKAMASEAVRKIDLMTLWIILLAGLSAAIIVLLLVIPPKIVGYDFLAFWCGARAVISGLNPYLNQPLHACEIAQSPAFFLQYPNVSVPAPLPPYALALFTPLSLLPYVVARAVWWFSIVLCVLLEARLIQRLTGRTYLFGAIACGFALTAPVILQGALAPLPVLLLTAGAYALRNARWPLGTALIAGAMIEPHMALPACLAAGIFLPKTRAPLILFGAVAAGLALIAVGPHVLSSYFSDVLPVHAASELDNLGQDSLTAILHHLGVADAAAIHLGSLQYAAFVVMGIVFGGRLVRREKDASWAVLVPAAFAVIGGEFIHLSEVTMAIPLAAVLAIRNGGRHWVPVFMLALPGEALINYGIFYIPGALVLALLLREIRAPGRWIVTGSIALVGLSVILHFFAMQQIGTTAAPIADPGPSALASVSWGDWNRLSFIGPIWWVEKILTLFPMLLLVFSTFSFAFPEPRQRKTATAFAAAVRGIPGEIT